MYATLKGFEARVVLAQSTGTLHAKLKSVAESKKEAARSKSSALKKPTQVQLVLQSFTSSQSFENETLSLSTLEMSALFSASRASFAMSISIH